MLSRWKVYLISVALLDPLLLHAIRDFMVLQQCCSRPSHHSTMQCQVGCIPCSHVLACCQVVANPSKSQWSLPQHIAYCCYHFCGTSFAQDHPPTQTPPSTGSRRAGLGKGKVVRNRQFTFSAPAAKVNPRKRSNINHNAARAYRCTRVKRTL